MKYDIIIIGAGIIGLATGLKFLEKNPNLKILLLEKENGIAKHQTGNNSGVIHSGIYYKPGSMKARNCINGYNQLLEFCAKNDIKFDICGKLIVAVKEKEILYLEKLFERGIENGLKGLQKLTREELKDFEPNVNGVAGIFVPQTGIIDFLEVSKKYCEVIQNYGVDINLNEEVIGIQVATDSCEVISKNKSYQTKKVVSCAGLFSDRIAKMTHPDLNLRIIPFRGEYYKIKAERKHLVKNLIYPVPDPNFPFLGVHFTRTINDEVEAGPNAVLAFHREGYKKSDINVKDTWETFTWPGFLSIAKEYWRMGFGEFYRSYFKTAFVHALQKLIPEITKEDLERGGSGVRAQACDKSGGLLDDFFIVGNDRIHHVCNAPSPAATASLSIGEYIAEKILTN
ncbi:MAG: hydroxyglutarate oxidase [Ignavibacteria bacterium RBG_13_36_8]|nr:MAG: hydroxyglutarate oxidase [Ignavibacteria bacterium RBG_13_36_8]